MEDLRRLTDKELYKRAQEAGQNARKWLKVFAGLLPEVQRRELYKKYGFCSIFEFAAKLAGMSRETVLEILRVGDKVEDKPQLKKLFEQGRQGWTKIKTAASVATTENEGLWAKKVETLSKCALEELARAERAKQKKMVTEVPFRPGTESRLTSRHSLTIQLEPEIYARLLDLKNNLSKNKKEPVDYNKVIEELLNGYDPKSRNLPQYQEVIHRCPDCEKIVLKSGCGDIELEEKDLKNREKIGETVEITKKPSRYIPAKVKKVIQLKHGKGCAYPGCKKPAKVLHHTKRFALDPRPDPELLKPLCKKHHELCHGGAVVKEEANPVKWSLSLETRGSEEKQRVDERFFGCRGVSQNIRPNRVP